MSIQNTQGYINIQSTELFFLENEVANFGSRALAYIIDTIFKISFIFALLFAVRMVADINKTLAIILVSTLGLFFFGYHVIIEFLMAGKTPGKWLVGIRTIKIDGSRISILDSLSRNILRIIDFLPMGYMLAMFIMFFEKYHRRYGDIVGNTIVIYDKPAQMPLSSYIDTRLRQAEPDNSVAISGIQKLTDEEKSIAKSIYLRLPQLSGEEKQKILSKFHSKLKNKINLEGSADTRVFLEEIVKRI